MKKGLLLMLVMLLLTTALSGCSGNKEEKVVCSLCNGTGEVKYYYGDNDDEFTMGVCTSCDGKGYSIITPSNKKSKGDVVCDSCGKYVSEVITKADAAGESRTWCNDCWNNYEEIMGIH